MWVINVWVYTEEVRDKMVSCTPGLCLLSAEILGGRWTNGSQYPYGSCTWCGGQLAVLRSVLVVRPQSFDHVGQQHKVWHVWCHITILTHSILLPGSQHLGHSHC